MKIYRATVSYNNGDTNEWEDWYSVNSPWYTTKEEAKKHFPELQKLIDYLSWKNIDNYNFRVDNTPKIEEQELSLPQEYKPMEVIRGYGFNTFKPAEFHYIEEMPSLEIKSVELDSGLDYPGIRLSFFVKIGEEGINVDFFDDDDLGLTIETSARGENKFYLYTPEISKAIIETVKKKVAEPVIALNTEIKRKWKEYHASDEGEEHMLKWHNARTTELQNVYKACVQLKATLSEYATRTLGYRNTQIFDDVIKYSRYKFDEFKDELHFINKLQTL